jgi:hypothetical protein
MNGAPGWAALGDGEGWAEELHVVGAHLGGVVDVGGAPAWLPVLGVEELLHLSGRGVGDEEAAGAFPDEGEGVGDAAGAEDGVASFEVVGLGADLDEVIALDDVEPLVFGVALAANKMRRWL